MFEIKPAILESEELTPERIVDAIANGTLDRTEAVSLIEKLIVLRTTGAASLS